jgi:hypothetical protein
LAFILGLGLTFKGSEAFYIENGFGLRTCEEFCICDCDWGSSTSFAEHKN